MCGVRNIIFGQKGERHFEGNKYLDLEIDKQPMECVQPTEKELRRGHIVQDVAGESMPRSTGLFLPP